MMAALAASSKSRTTYWRSAATRCRSTRFPRPSRSCRRSTSARPENWRGAMAKPARTVLVTGASRGLGLGIARQLADAGYDVIALARQKSKQVTDAIAEAKRGKSGALHFVSFDLGEVGEIPGLVKDLRKDFGPLFGLVNNAAVGHDGALAMMHNSEIVELVRVNTLSPIILTKYVVRAMMSVASGRVVNVNSIIGFPR